jgi:nicotinate-nucleotide adenylyltransferase
MRIGILGGTFDPIHNGHLEMADRAQTFFSCDRVYLMPAYSPPHKAKGSITSSYHRYAMAALATMDRENVDVSRLELESPSQPYTVQTIMKLRERLGNAAAIFFIMGADSFRELETWREYRQLIASCHIVVITRPGYQIDLAERGARLQTNIIDLRGQRQSPRDVESDAIIYLTDLLELDISATAIRKAVAQHQEIREFVPSAVAHYIKKYQLYQEENETNN